MKDILHTICLRHDNTLKSLTKQALAQIILKLVYINNVKGLSISQVRDLVRGETGVNFTEKDILDSLRWLENDGEKIYAKSGKYRIKPNYLKSIDKEVERTNQLHDDIIIKWFRDTDSYKADDGKNSILDWFQGLMIEFFKDYSYDWVRDLMRQKGNGKKKTPNLEKIIDKSLASSNLAEEDYGWLKKQFVKFIESDTHEDNEVLWNYASSRFSATLLTARNFADDFSLEEFDGATFILDTNILMILELEEYEQSQAISTLAEFFKKHNISPKYFYVSRDEYGRAIGPKRRSTLKAFDEYSFKVFSESNCVFINTALKRKCVERADFERFFDQIMDVPEKFGNVLDLECEDNSDLIEVFEKAESDEKLKGSINTVYKRRTGNDKRETPKKHDAALYRGAEHLKKQGKTLILTRDSILREFAYEDAVRDELPLAIGVDSLIQLLALDAGGTGNTSSNFIPLFSKLVQTSLFPEKEMFKPEDLEYILESRINILQLDDEHIIEIAKKVNKLRYTRSEDDDVALEIRRLFQSGVGDMKEVVKRAVGEKERAEEDAKTLGTSLENFEGELFQSKLTNAISDYRKKVIWNYVKLVGLISISVILFYVLYSNVGIEKNWIVVTCNIVSDIVAAILWSIFGFGNKLRIPKSQIEEDVKKEIKELKTQ